jgi:hypothetical protein
VKLATTSEYRDTLGVSSRAVVVRVGVAVVGLVLTTAVDVVDAVFTDAVATNSANGTTCGVGTVMGGTRAAAVRAGVLRVTGAGCVRRDGVHRVSADRDGTAAAADANKSDTFTTVCDGVRAGTVVDRVTRGVAR